MASAVAPVQHLVFKYGFIQVTRALVEPHFVLLSCLWKTPGDNNDVSIGTDSVVDGGCDRL
jgi:hypothetical protein